ncbi:uncharacterized protein LOC144701437 [Wolffia australiana]
MTDNGFERSRTKSSSAAVPRLQARTVHQNQNPRSSQNRSVAQYDLGGEGDLFKAPEPIMEEPEEFDLLAAAISSMIAPEEIIAESIQGVNGMRRDSSECDILQAHDQMIYSENQTNTLFPLPEDQRIGQSFPLPSVPRNERQPTICEGVEDREQKLSRYRRKKMKRNFGRKIEYAGRKALADSQPRVRGRFAKTETACRY